MAAMSSSAYSNTLGRVAIERSKERGGTLGAFVTSTPHDAIFKAVFQQPEHAAGELRYVLSAELAAAIDWSSLALESGTFVDEGLADQHSDLLFSALARTSGQKVFVYLLFEHQSTHEPRMALRLLGYMVRIWSRFGDANPGAPLPLIVPAVLAQVPGGWKAPTRFSELFSHGLGALASAVLPDFSYAVDDLDRADDESLRSRELAEQARLALWVMRDAREGAVLLSHLAGWAASLEALARSPGGEEKLALLLRYVALVANDLQLSEFRAILRGRAPAAESVTMTLAEQLQAKGRAEGRAEGRAKGQVGALLVILKARSIHMTDEARLRIETCEDPETLELWLVRAATVEALDDVFGP